MSQDSPTPQFATARAKTEPTTAEALRARLGKTAKRTASPIADDAKFAKIKDNHFYKIIYDSSKSPQQKKDAIEASLVFDPTLSEQQNAARLSAYKDFDEYMQNERKKMAVALIKLNDTEAFAQLRNVIDEMSNGFNAFNRDIQYFLDILDAVDRLTAAGVKFHELAGEIEADRENEARLQQQITSLQNNVSDEESAIYGIQRSIDFAKQQRSWKTMFRGPDADTRARIEELGRDMQTKQDGIVKLGEQIEATRVELGTPRDSKFTDLIAEKAKVRELLDISSDAHRAKQQQLMDTANNFVEVSDSNVGAVLSTIEAMTGRIEMTATANGRMLGSYAVMNDAVKGAMDKNQSVLATEEVAPSEESSLQKMERNDRVVGIQRHIRTLSGARESTTQNFDALTKERAELESMRESNERQVESTTQLYSSGLANMGMQMNSVIQAVSSAGIAQASSVAQSHVDNMADKAMEVKSSQAIRNALQFEARNEQLEKAIELTLKGASDLRETRELTREQLQNIKANLGHMELAAREYGEAIDSSISTAAEADRNVATVYNDPQPGSASQAPASDPFAPAAPAPKP